MAFDKSDPLRLGTTMVIPGLLSAASLIRIGIVLLAAYTAYNIRLYALIDYGLVIHEFDPWFNYRSTEYLWEKGAPLPPPRTLGPLFRRTSASSLPFSSLLPRNCTGLARIVVPLSHPMPLSELLHPALRLTSPPPHRRLGGVLPLVRPP